MIRNILIKLAQWLGLIPKPNPEIPHSPTQEEINQRNAHIDELKAKRYEFFDKIMAWVAETYQISIEIIPHTQYNPMTGEFEDKCLRNTITLPIEEYKPIISPWGFTTRVWIRDVTNNVYYCPSSKVDALEKTKANLYTCKYTITPMYSIDPSLFMRHNGINEIDLFWDGVDGALIIRIIHDPEWLDANYPVE